MYKAKATFSTKLSESITDTQTTIPVDDITQFPDDLPNIATIVDKNNQLIETIEYTEKNGNNLIGVTRGLEGIPQNWSIGTPIGRFHTALEQNDIIDNIFSNLSEINKIIGATTGWADSRIVEHNLNVTDPSNGYYVRWNNGLQVCFVKRTFLGDIDVDAQLVGSGWYRSTATDNIYNLPANFIDIPSVHIVKDGTVPFNIFCSSYDIRTYQLGFVLFSPSEVLDFNCEIFCFITGRWK